MDFLDLPLNKLPKLLERGFDGYAMGHWVCRTEVGVEARHIMHPDFWVHVTDRMRVNHRIEVLARDGSLDAELRVIAIDVRGHWAKMRLLRGWPQKAWESVEADEPALAEIGDTPDPDGYIVEFGGAHKYRILHGGVVIEHHIPTKALAHARLAEIKAEKAAA